MGNFDMYVCHAVIIIIVAINIISKKWIKSISLKIQGMNFTYTLQFHFQFCMPTHNIAEKNKHGFHFKLNDFNPLLANVENMVSSE
jgi:hypothetical protein